MSCGLQGRDSDTFERMTGRDLRNQIRDGSQVVVNHTQHTLLRILFQSTREDLPMLTGGGGSRLRAGEVSETVALGTRGELLGEGAHPWSGTRDHAQVEGAISLCQRPRVAPAGVDIHVVGKLREKPGLAAPQRRHR